MQANPDRPSDLHGNVDCSGTNGIGTWSEEMMEKQQWIGASVVGPCDPTSDSKDHVDVCTIHVSANTTDSQTD
jgi:hypothetical protein